jgi:23S rRNA C2498 (ribose-2'-O)-methylase RlmM
LSWFYVQQKSFEGLHSGKAIYKRNPESLSNIVNLANLSIEESDQDMAKEILDFVIENTKDLQLLIQAQTYLIKMKIDKAQDIDFAAINAELS